MKFVGRGRCEDVLTYPLHVASVYRSCSLVPEFAVSLPSVHASRHTTLRLANWLHQLASERLSLSGIIWYFYVPDAHAGHTQHLAEMAGDEQVESFLLSIIFVAGDCFVAVNPPLTASCKQLWPIKTLKEGEL
jgi:hypothetical protein